MPTAPLTTAGNRRNLQRVAWWAAAAVYTVTLPWVILGFNIINRHFSSKITANLSHFIMILVGVFYTTTCLKNKMASHCYVILAAGLSIVLVIVHFETNPNKYIHIPEYVLMTWILYRALAIDYKGSGMFLLIFTCGAMLGIVDEILQGIHPQRTYGWKDMIIDTASVLIGILMLAGLKKRSRRDWGWVRHLWQFKYLLAVMIFGVATAGPMCMYLFVAQNQGVFFPAYPRWLLSGNGLFLIFFGIAGVCHWFGRRKSDRYFTKKQPDSHSDHRTAFLWIICPLVILAGMQGLVIWVALAGLKFN